MRMRMGPEPWKQGQHIAIMGRTGRGKTFLARDLLTLREYVVALGIKRWDDTLDTFPQAGYQRIKKWPPEYGKKRVLFWARPKNLSDNLRIQGLLTNVFNDCYENGGWTVFYDDVAFIANSLGFRKILAVLLNQARSGHSSQVCAMTQPSSIAQSIPSELWRQVRFHLVFYYRTGRDLDVISDMVGYPKFVVKNFMRQLRPFDFLAFDDLTDTVILVRSAA